MSTGITGIDRLLGFGLGARVSNFFATFVNVVPRFCLPDLVRHDTIQSLERSKMELVESIPPGRGTNHTYGKQYEFIENMPVGAVAKFVKGEDFNINPSSFALTIKNHYNKDGVDLCRVIIRKGDVYVELLDYGA